MTHWSPLGGTSDEPENYHVLDITLDAHDDATEVTLRQSNRNGQMTEEDQKHRDDFEKNWSATLDGLKRVVESSE